MSSNVEVLSRHVWLLQTILQAGPEGMLLGRVQSLWEARWGTRYARKTFCNHRNAIAEIFGIEIKCNRHTNRYYIPFYSQYLDSTSARSWLVNTLTITNTLSQGGGNLDGRMEIEEIPSGQLWLTSILSAMDKNAVLEISYRKYTSTESEKLTIHPYALREMDRRWYLVAYCLQRKDMRVYGLDRVLSVEETGESFEMPKGFSLEKLFRYSYGTYLPEQGQKESLITFKATSTESKYLRDLPIHPTQKEVEENLFTIEVIPNENLIMEFCRLGNRVEVISPSDIREKVKEELLKAASIYGD